MNAGMRKLLVEAREHFEAAVSLSGDGVAAPHAEGGAPLASTLVWLAKALLLLSQTEAALDTLARARALPPSCKQTERAQAAAEKMLRTFGR